MQRDRRRISVVGLGYVGLPVAVAFARAGFSVVAFDISEIRIAELRRGEDRTREISSTELAGVPMLLTTDPESLRRADFHIVTVPTPITDARRPDLGPLLAATRLVGRHLKVGDIVVYESTVYPGATETECAPLLEAESGLVHGRDFTVGYSPERINPGDTAHRFENIVKVVSGSDPRTADIVAEVYGEVVRAGVHKAPSIAVAEAAKVIENTQRDLNIALMNELSLIFHRLDIDTADVLAAAGTKWNFLPFTPGLVGGHCIGVDPYYLTHRAEQAGYHPAVILAGRGINDSMGRHIALETIRRLSRRHSGGPHRVIVLGLTFKEDVPDLRNTRVIDIIRELEGFGVLVAVHDPLSDAAEARAEYGLDLTDHTDALTPAHGVVLATPHRAYREAGWPLIINLLEGGGGVVMDVKSCLDRAKKPDGVDLWRL